MYSIFLTKVTKCFAEKKNRLKNKASLVGFVGPISMIFDLSSILKSFYLSLRQARRSSKLLRLAGLKRDLKLYVVCITMVGDPVVLKDLVERKHIKKQWVLSLLKLFKTLNRLFG